MISHYGHRKCGIRQEYEIFQSNLDPIFFLNFTKLFPNLTYFSSTFSAAASSFFLVSSKIFLKCVKKEPSLQKLFWNFAIISDGTMPAVTDVVVVVVTAVVVDSLWLEQIENKSYPKWVTNQVTNTGILTWLSAPFSW